MKIEADQCTQKMRQSKLQICPARIHELISNTPSGQKLSRIDTLWGQRLVEQVLVANCLVERLLVAHCLVERLQSHWAAIPGIQGSQSLLRNKLVAVGGGAQHSTLQGGERRKNPKCCGTAVPFTFDSSSPPLGTKLGQGVDQ